jgi:hypothetical protein
MKVKYEVNFKESSFYKPGIQGEEFTDILPSTAAVLKDIPADRGRAYIQNQEKLSPDLLYVSQ